MLKIEPVTLLGTTIRLEPLSEDHVPDLALVGLDDNIWRYMLYGQIQTQADMRRWVLEILERQACGTDLAFTVVLQANNKAVGATRYLDIRPEHRGLEIGGTWYGVAYQRTVVNSEAKFLLLQHAFENLGCVRVQFKTDLRNVRSQRALARIGAVQEGILRNHIITPEGYIRDSVYFSIIDREWPVVKARLQAILQL